MRYGKAVALDFDGTIHDGPFINPLHFSKPYDGAKEFCAALKEMGYKIVIYTCRMNQTLCDEFDMTKASVARGLANWLEYFEIPFDFIDHSDKPLVELYIDDKAIACRSWEAPAFEKIIATLEYGV